MSMLSNILSAQAQGIPSKSDEKKAVISKAAQDKQAVLAGTPAPEGIEWDTRPASSSMDIFAGSNMAMHPEETGEEGEIYVHGRPEKDPMQEALNRLARKGQEGIADPQIEVAYDPNNPDPMQEPAYYRNAVTKERLDPYMYRGEEGASFAEDDLGRLQQSNALDRAAAPPPSGMLGHINAAQAAQQLLARKPVEQEATSAYDPNAPVSGDFSEDIGKIAIKGGKQLGEMGWGVADYGSRVLAAPIEMLTGADIPTLEETTGWGAKLHKNIQEGTKEYTKETQEAMAEVSKRSQESEAREAAIIKAKKADGTYNPVVDEPLRLASEFIDGVGAYWDNPRAAGEAAIASSPQFLLGGGIGKVASTIALKAATKGARAGALKRFAKTDAGKELISKVANRANLGYTVVAEGISNGVEAKAQVEGMSHEELMKDDGYAKLIESGMSPEKAKSKISYKAMDITAAMSGLGAGVISKFSGANAFQANIFNKSSPISKIVKQAAQGDFRKGATKALGGFLKEGVEETGQEGFGKFSQNVAEKFTTNEDKDIGAGVGSNAAGGFVAGGLTGGAIGSVQATPNVIGLTGKGIGKLTPQRAKEALQGVAGKVAETTEKAKEAKEIFSTTVAGKEEKILDINAVDYDPAKATEKALHIYGKAKGVKERKAAFAKVYTHIEQRQEAADKFASNKPVGMSDADHEAAVEKENALIEASLDRVFAVQDSFQKETAADADTVAKVTTADANLSNKDNTEYTQEDKSAVIDAIVDAPSDAPYDTSALKANPNLPEEIKELIAAYEDNSDYAGATGKSGKDVLTEITQASESEFGKGLQGHMKSIDTHLLTGNLSKASTGAYRIGRFLINQRAKLAKLNEASEPGETLEWGAKWPADISKNGEVQHKKGDAITWTVDSVTGPQSTHVWANNHLPKEIALMESHYNLAVARIKAKAIAAGINPDNLITPLGEKRKKQEKPPGTVGIQHRKFLDTEGNIGPNNKGINVRRDFKKLYDSMSDAQKEEALGSDNGFAKIISKGLDAYPNLDEMPKGRDGKPITRKTLDKIFSAIEKYLNLDDSRPDSVPAESTPTQEQGSTVVPPVTPPTAVPDNASDKKARRGYINEMYNKLTEEQKKQFTPDQRKYAEAAETEGAYNDINIFYLDALVSKITLLTSADPHGLNKALQKNARNGLDKWLDTYIAKLLKDDSTNRQAVIAQSILKKLRENTRDLSVFAVDSKVFRESTGNDALAKTFAGTTSVDGKHIGLDLNRISLNNNKMDIFTILMHEYVHASTNKLIFQGKNTDALDAVLKEINDALASGKHDESLAYLQEGVPYLNKETSTYQFSNVKEMMAFVLSGDTYVSGALAAIPLSQGTFISQLAKALLGFLGIKNASPDEITALEKVLTVSANFLDDTIATTPPPTPTGKTAAEIEAQRIKTRAGAIKQKSGQLKNLLAKAQKGDVWFTEADLKVANLTMSDEELGALYDEAYKTNPKAPFAALHKEIQDFVSREKEEVQTTVQERYPGKSKSWYTMYDESYEEASKATVEYLTFKASQGEIKNVTEDPSIEQYAYMDFWKTKNIGSASFSYAKAKVKGAAEYIYDNKDGKNKAIDRQLSDYFPVLTQNEYSELKKLAATLKDASGQTEASLAKWEERKHSIQKKAEKVVKIVGALGGRIPGFVEGAMRKFVPEAGKIFLEEQYYVAHGGKFTPFAELPQKNQDRLSFEDNPSALKEFDTLLDQILAQDAFIEKTWKSDDKKYPDDFREITEKATGTPWIWPEDIEDRITALKKAAPNQPQAGKGAAGFDAIAALAAADAAKDAHEETEEEKAARQFAEIQGLYSDTPVKYSIDPNPFNETNDSEFYEEEDGLAKQVREDEDFYTEQGDPLADMARESDAPVTIDPSHIKFDRMYDSTVETVDEFKRRIKQNIGGNTDAKTAELLKALNTYAAYRDDVWVKPAADTVDLTKDTVTLKEGMAVAAAISREEDVNGEYVEEASTETLLQISHELNNALRDIAYSFKNDKKEKAVIALMDKISALRGKPVVDEKALSKAMEKAYTDPIAGPALATLYSYTPKDQKAYDHFLNTRGEVGNQLKIFGNLQTSNKAYRDIRDGIIDDFRTNHLSHDKLMADIVAYYENQGWPTAADIFINPMKNKKNGYSVSQLFRSKNKHARSLLAMIPNLFSSIFRIPEFGNSIVNMLELTEDEKQKLSNLNTVVNEYKNAIEQSISIRSNVSKKFGEALTPNEASYNLLVEQQAGNEFGEISENIVAAVAMASEVYLGTQATQTLFTDDLGISKILSLQDEKEVTDKMRKIFMESGVPIKDLANQLGIQIRLQVNITAQDTADGRIGPHMDQSLGMLALAAMINQGYLEISSITSVEIANLFEDAEDRSESYEEKTSLNLVRVVPAKERSKFGLLLPNEKHVERVNTTKEYDALRDKLFNVGKVEGEPSKTPVTRVAQLLKGTSMKTSKIMREAYKKAQSVEWHGNQRQANIIKRFGYKHADDESLGRWAIVRMAGGVIEDSGHVTKTPGNASRNAGIIRDLDNNMEYLGGMTKEESMYMEYTAIVNGRAMINQQKVNPQASKVARFLTSARSWMHTYKLDDKDDIDKLKVAIAEALGSGTSDQTPRDVIVDWFDANVMDSNGEIREDFAKAIEIINSDTAQFSDKEMGTIEAAVKKGGENLHSLDGLTALADYQKAILDPETTTISSDIAREVDGITNGVLTAMLQLAPEGVVDDIIRKAGVKLDNDEYPEQMHAERIAAGHDDNYQTLARETKKEIQAAIDNVDDNIKKLEAEIVELQGGKNPDKAAEIEKKNNLIQKQKDIKWFTPFVNTLVGEFMKEAGSEDVSKRGRDLSKPSLLVNVYGARIRRIIKNASVEIKKNFYDDLMKYESDMKLKLTTNAAGQKQHTTESQDAQNKLVDLLHAAYMLKIITPMDTGLRGQGVQKTVEYKDAIRKQAEQTALDLQVAEKSVTQNIQMRTQKIDKAWTSESENFTNKIATYFGKPLESALSKYLGSFNQDWDQLNEASQFMNDVWYEMVEFEKIRIKQTEKGRWWNAVDEKAFVDKHIKTGTIPSISHANSDTESGKFDDHLQLTVKKQVSFSSKEAAENGVAVNLKFKSGEGIQKRDMVTDKLDDQQDSLTTRIKMEDFTNDVGIRSLAIINQSQDGAVQTAPMTERDILNLYDAIMEGAANVDEGATLNNKTLVENMKKWGMVMEMLKSVKRLEKMYDKLPEKTRERMAKTNALNDKRTPEEFLEDFPKFAEMVDKRHQAIVDRITYMNQYSSHNAWFQIEETIPKTSEAAVDALAQEIESDYPHWEQTESDAPINNNKPSPLNALNVEETFQKIKGVGNIQPTPEHAAYLDNFVNSIIKPTLSKLDTFFIQSPDKIKERVKGKLKGKTLYLEGAASSDTLSATMSSQEVFAHEMTYGILRDGIKFAPKVRNELRRLYRIAKKDKALTWKAFVDKNADPSNPEEQAAAQRRYDQVFNSTKENEYLYKFASFGLTNEQFIDHLGKIDSKKYHTVMAGTIPERIAGAFNMLMDALRTLGNKNQPMNVRDGLFQISANVASATNAANNKFDSMWSTKMDALNSKTKTAFTNFILAPYLKSSTKVMEKMQNGKQSKITKVMSDLYVTPNLILFGQYGEAITEVAYGAGLTMDNVGFKLMNEMAGSNPKTKNFYKLLRQAKHAIDTAMEQVATNSARDVRNMFGRNLTNKEWVAITDMYLRTDFAALLDKGFTREELRDFITWDGSINKAIKETEAKLKSAFPNNHEYYIIQGASLGGFMSTGKMGIGDGKLNAHSIAQLHNLEDFGLYNPEGDLDTAEGLIDTLATLHAIKSMPTNTRKIAAGIAKEENAREVEVNGIDFVIGLYDNIKKESLEKLFHGDKTLMVKGYTHSLYDTTKSMEIAPKSKREEMELKGYTMRGPLAKDKKYKHAPQQYIYTSNQGLQTPRATGIMGFKGKDAMGSDMIELAYQENDPAVRAQGSRTANPYSMAYDAFTDYRIEMHAELVKQFKGKAKLDYSSNWLVGKTDSKGNARNYRYIMSEGNKREFLGKEDVAHNVLGRMEADIVSKINTQKHNLAFLKEAYKDFKENFADNTRGFVEIGPEVVYENPLRSDAYNNKKTKYYRELYRLLPTDTQRDMRVVWGGDTITIREDLVDMAMGFSKASVITWLDDKMNYAGLGIPGFIKNQARLVALLWVQIVAKAKRHNVLFLPAVFLNNMISNGLALIMVGVPPMYALRKQKEAIGALDTYKADLRKQSTLKRTLKATPNHTQKKSIQRKLDRLTLEIKNNPVTALVDEGLFQSITEDLGQGLGKDDKLAKSALNILPDAVGEFIDNQTEKVPANIKKLYNFGILHPDDPTAQFLTKATQYSDFVARYALYSYRTEVQKKAKETAIEEAIDIFINYDVPTSPEMQWLNDMGAFVFTKFMFRAQRVIARAFRDQPARMAAIQSIQAATGIDAADIVDAALGISKSPTNNIYGVDDVPKYIADALGIQVDEIFAAVFNPGSAL